MAISRGNRSRKTRIEPMWFGGPNTRRGVVLVQQGEHSFFIWDAWGPRMTWEQTEDCQFCVDRYTPINSSVVTSGLDVTRKHQKTTYDLRTPTYDEANIIEEHRSEIHKVLKEIGNDKLFITTLWTQESINDEMDLGTGRRSTSRDPESVQVLHHDGGRLVI